MTASPFTDGRQNAARQDKTKLTAIRARGLALDRKMFALRTDNDLAQLAALRAGCGIGACQVGIARRDPNLIPVLPAAFSLKLEIWVAMHADLRRSARCRIASEALTQGLLRYVASVKGRRTT